MKKRSKQYLFMSVFFIFLIYITTFVIAAPPFTATTNGLTIEPVLVDYIKEGVTYKFHIHVFNVSNGYPINSGISCDIHLYNSTGNHLFKQQVTVASDLWDYEFIVNGKNFTRGDYQAKFSCNNSLYGGGSEISFKVNPLGIETGIAEAVLYTVLTFAVLLLFSIVLYINIIIPWGDVKNEIGELLFISNWKYLKVGMVLISYSLFVWLLNILVGISDNFLGLSMYYGFFSFVFNAFMRLSPIVFIVVIVLMAALFIRDKILRKDITKFGRVFKK